jgi:RNA polymerase sigma-70 factor (ECF subfamily)
MANRLNILEKKQETTPIEPAASLVPYCLAGNEKARETLARWCLPKVRRTVMLTYGTGPDADDLSQIAIARVFQRLDSYRGDALFYTWVDRITVNVVRDHYRSHKSRSIWETFSALMSDLTTKTEPEEEFGRYELMERLSKHLSHIRLERRIPLVLYLAQGYTAPEIADMLGLSSEAVKKRLQRGRRELLGLIRKDPNLLEIMDVRKR